tara:strand:- start:129 stop:341 length:213 start_codon:yes stop_codon:yes gene_type:complete
MTTNNTKQEIAEYREQIKMLIETVDILASSNMSPQTVEILLTSAHWTLDKYPQEDQTITKRESPYREEDQ